MTPNQELVEKVVGGFGNLESITLTPTDIAIELCGDSVMEDALGRPIKCSRVAGHDGNHRCNTSHGIWAWGASGR